VAGVLAGAGVAAERHGGDVTADKIRRAVTEAKRFLAAAHDGLEEMKEEGHDYWTVGTRKSGALRRASLDLTRALADMRKAP
jgi:hypothetical protein